MKTAVLKYGFVTGMHHYGSRKLNEGVIYYLQRDRNNAYDSNAVCVLDKNGAKVAYLSRISALHISKIIDEMLNHQHPFLKINGDLEIIRRKPVQRCTIGIRMMDADVEQCKQLLSGSGFSITIKTPKK